jgi:metalloendopeptidase OMA1, mitochondrial
MHEVLADVFPMLSRKSLSIIPAVFALIVVSCSVSSFDPNTGEVRASAPSSSLVSQGAQAFDKMKREKKISRNSSYNAQVNRVAARLKSVIKIPNARWEFVVFEDSTPNAFALPGGKVGVHTGLFQITQNDAGLAAVLGHEIAHVVLNHSQQRVNQATGVAVGTALLDAVLSSRGADRSTRAVAATGAAAAGTVGLILPYSRKAELQSDQLGTLYMARAGYNPEESIKLWKRFAAWRMKQSKGESPEFLRTHPLDQTRINALQEFLPTAQREYKPR